MSIRQKLTYTCKARIKKVKTLFDAKFCADFKYIFKNLLFLDLKVLQAKK